MGFHPFQGRPLFGPYSRFGPAYKVHYMFPSLSGKTSIRTFQHASTVAETGVLVFPSLSGKTSIRTRLIGWQRTSQVRSRFHPFQGRPLFGRRIKGKMIKNKSLSFHPFQGRPLFGHAFSAGMVTPPTCVVSIPFREDLYSDHHLK